MQIRVFFAIFAAKCARIVLRALGRSASSFPGTIALKLCPDILSRLILPELTVAVTGSNGKTTTVELIMHTAVLTGRRVICNREGSNQIEGVTAMFVRHSTLGGRVRADIAVIESDERFCQHTFKYFSPGYILVTNLFRDQLTRNGHSEFVRKEMAKGLPESSRLILNADEPVSASLGAGRKNALWYGVEREAFCEPPETAHAYWDGAYCPVCYAKMDYEYRVTAHVGAFRCDTCGFARARCDHAVTAARDGRFILDDAHPVRPQLCNTMFAYNIAAAFTVAVEVFGLAPAAAAGALDGYRLTNDRIRDVDISGHKGLFMLSKHENSMAYNGALATLTGSDSAQMTLVVIVDRLSRKYSASDMSWLWDIDFEMAAKDERVTRIIAGGRFAHELAARLLCAGVCPERLTVECDLDKMMDALYDNPVGDIYVLTCFTDVTAFTGRLRKEAGQ